MKKNDKLDIIYEDKYILIVNKPYNLLTIANEKEKEKTLFHKVYLYIKRKNKNNKIFIVHRLDKDTSGLIIFAKSEKVKKDLQDNWEQVTRKYIAVVYGQVKDKQGTVKSYLRTTKTNLVYSSNDKIEGKLAITDYRNVMSNNNYTLLEINIKTGRKNQIRVHMNDIGYPILGEKVYTNVKGRFNRLYLHAYYLSFEHPLTGEKMTFELDVPNDFIKKMNSKSYPPKL